MNQASPNAKMWAGIILAVIMVPAYIYMKQNDIDEQGLFYLLGPVVTYMLIGSKVDAVTQDQNTKLDKIQEQTNGVLDKRIRDGVRAALKEYDENGAKGL